MLDDRSWTGIAVLLDAEGRDAICEDIAIERLVALGVDPAEQ